MSKRINMGLRISPVIVAATMAVTSTFSSAAVLYWDSNGNVTGTDVTSTGSTWSTSSARWSTDPNGEATTINYAANSDAVFSAGTNASSATIALANSMSAASVEFQEGNYTFTHATGTTLTIGSGGVTMANGTSAAFNATAGAITLTFSGSPSQTTLLTLNGNAQLTAGAYSRTAGLVVVRGDNLGAASSSSNVRFTTTVPAMIGANTSDPTRGVITHMIGDTSASGTGVGLVTYDSTTGIRLLTAAEAPNAIVAGQNAHLTGGSTSVAAANAALNSLQLSGNNTVTGSTLTIASADLLVRDGTSSISQSIATSGLYVTTLGSSSLTIGGNIGNGSSALKFGTGTLAINGWVDGSFTINGGLVNYNGGGTGKIKGLTVNAGTLNVGSSNTVVDGNSVAVGSTTSAATMNVQNFVDTFSGLSFGTAGGTLKFTLGNTSAPTTPRIKANATAAMANSTISFNDTPNGTVGKYLLVQGVVNLTGTPTGTAPTGYRLSTTNGANGEVALIHKPEISTITASAADATIITGGSTAISGTVLNSAPVNSDSLSFGVAGSPNTGGTGNGTAAPQSTGAFSGLTFTPSGFGTQSTTLTVTDANATNSGQTQQVSVNVLAHSNAAFTDVTGGDEVVVQENDLTIDFGTVQQNSADPTAGFNLRNLLGANAVALLELDLLTPAGDSTALALTGDSTFDSLAGNGTEAYGLTFDTSTVGDFTATYTFRLSDQDLPGASAEQSELMTLTVTGSVAAVPEPTSIGLLTLGGLLLGRRRRR